MRVKLLASMLLVGVALGLATVFAPSEIFQILAVLLLLAAAAFRMVVAGVPRPFLTGAFGGVVAGLAMTLVMALLFERWLAAHPEQAEGMSAVLGTRDPDAMRGAWLRAVLVRYPFQLGVTLAVMTWFMSRVARRPLRPREAAAAPAVKEVPDA